jgi:ribosomal protein S18 acetylase RimI-like enzyme
VAQTPLSIFLLIESPAMEIQTASIRDLGALRRLEQACFEKDAWPLLDLIAVLTWPDVVRLKAVENGELIGFVAGDPRPSEGASWVATIGVDPRFQRRGIGRALLHACEEKTKLPRMKLTVRLSNEPAISLYEKEGYRSVDIWKRYYNDGEDGLVMEKTLHSK